jgi:hypothetical protein
VVVFEQPGGRVVASVIELLRDDNLLCLEPRPAAARAAASSRSRQSVASVPDDQLALDSASTDSIPNIARPSAVVVSMPCSTTCRPTPRSRNSAPSVTRCKTERPRRSSRVIFRKQRFHAEITAADLEAGLLL